MQEDSTGAEEERVQEGEERTGAGNAERTSKSAFCLFFVFGTSCWVTVNFVFAEVPLLIAQSFPAVGDLLTVVVVCCVQAANLAPLCIVLASLLRHRHANEEKQPLILNTDQNDLTTSTTSNTTTTKDTRNTLGRRAVPVLLVLALNVACCAALAAVPQPMPLALFVALCTLAGLAATTSSVVLLPFGSLYPPAYTAAIAAGNTSSALVAGVLALVQQPGVRDRLSFAAVMGTATALAAAALLAFVVLVAAPRYRALALPASLHRARRGPAPSPAPAAPNLSPAQGRRAVAAGAAQLFLQGFAENGVAMSVSAAALLPYGAHCFVAATACSFVAGPLAALLPSLLPPHIAARALDSTPFVAATTALYLAAAAYMGAIATLCRAPHGAPAPPLGLRAGAAAVCAARVAVRVLTQLGGVRAWTNLHGGGRRGPAIAPAQRMHAARLGGLALQLGGLAGTAAALLLALLAWSPARHSSGSASSSLLFEPFLPA